MKKFRVFGVVTGTKYLGEFEAETKEQAEEMALNSGANYVSQCHQCTEEFELNDICCHDASAEEI